MKVKMQATKLNKPHVYLTKGITARQVLLYVSLKTVQDAIVKTVGNTYRNNIFDVNLEVLSNNFGQGDTPQPLLKNNYIRIVLELPTDFVEEQQNTVAIIVKVGVKNGLGIVSQESKIETFYGAITDRPLQSADDIAHNCPYVYSEGSDPYIVYCHLPLTQNAKLAESLLFTTDEGLEQNIVLEYIEPAGSNLTGIEATELSYQGPTYANRQVTITVQNHDSGTPRSTRLPNRPSDTHKTSPQTRGADTQQPASLPNRSSDTHYSEAPNFLTQECGTANR